MAFGLSLFSGFLRIDFPSFKQGLNGEIREVSTPDTPYLVLPDGFPRGDETPGIVIRILVKLPEFRNQESRADRDQLTTMRAGDLSIIVDFGNPLHIFIEKHTDIARLKEFLERDNILITVLPALREGCPDPLCQILGCRCLPGCPVPIVAGVRDYLHWFT
jgi:hypothetical protein